MYSTKCLLGLKGMYSGCRPTSLTTYVKNKSLGKECCRFMSVGVDVYGNK